jgi:hypothetical protein
MAIDKCSNYSTSFQSILRTRTCLLTTITILNFAAISTHERQTLEVITVTLPVCGGKGATWRAITRSPGCATLAMVHVKTSLHAAASFIPTTILLPPAGAFFLFFFFPSLSSSYCPVTPTTFFPSSIAHLIL